MPSTTRENDLRDLQRLIEHASSQLHSRAKLIGAACTYYNDSNHAFEVHTTLGRRELLLGKGLNEEQALAAAVELLMPDLLKRTTAHIAPKAVSAESLPNNARVVRRPRRTIGVSAPESLWSAVKFAGEGAKQSTVVRMLLRKGMNLFDEGLKHDRSSKVDERFEEALTAYRGPSRPVMARVDEPLYCELLVTAHEHGRTLSSFSASCLAVALNAQQAVG
ncbi:MULTISPECIES: hypothetical protein [Stenotrophomonas]|uniref:hypothetical protein n=1 Tax=Stenotrophomonas TaxID=40323 RepID=UPI0018D31ADF|nr:hypothetical protein [Stenotrophomonas sp. Sm0041]MBH1408305.1 hypothetical protein [Stenotrophomonas maltophilia]MBH1481752.1 hypothetical protein [Stenotrophomonas maltophilia]MDQ7292544.1 hypothetical protein [Stenotrophomonas sp. Sm0041]HDS1300706.1 hypothetical protein [Stenotrophomonas maltophilia]HDS1303120.1 hypothetical protein [Stenotrophomonas maltophilia]